MPQGREPSRQIAHVCLDVFERTRRALDAVTWRLCDEARRASVRVSVVVGEVVEARFGDPSTNEVSVNISRFIEGDCKVECASRRSARSRGDDTRVAFSGGNVDSPFVWMSGKKLDESRRRAVPQKFVCRPDGLDLLVVTVSSR